MSDKYSKKEQELITMMDNAELEKISMTRNIGIQVGIEEKQVTIRMLSVDGKNMTKAFFLQLPEHNPFKEPSSVSMEDGVTVWGYVTFLIGSHPQVVNDFREGNYLIYEKLGTLYRHHLWSEYHRRIVDSLQQLFIGA